MEEKEEFLSHLFSPQDLMQLEAHGMDYDLALERIQMIIDGTPYPEIIASASLERGVIHVNREDYSIYMDLWNDYLHSSESNVCKMVPASGAATRMFKDLYNFLDAPYDEPQTEQEKMFFDHIDEFAFFELLNESCLRNEWKPIQRLISTKDYKTVVKNLLTEKGINYGNMPKGLLLFHHGLHSPRTAVEEHMVEAVSYAKPSSGKVKLHFTVSEKFRGAFENLIKKKKEEYEDYYCMRFDISMSVQKSSTDTIALTPEGEIFRLPSGEILFRPGGHGALIENLNELDADIIFIKNIDNVVPAEHLCDTIIYKQLLAGILIAVRKKVFRYVNLLKAKKASSSDMQEMIKFLHNNFCVDLPETDLDSDDALAESLLRKLDRPIRVCGMVRNEGAPGGGPFIVREPDGSSSLQILESSQINKKDSEQMAFFENGQFFNPVDLVCSKLKPEGGYYRLSRFVNPRTAFVSEKTYNGKSLLGLELPGLWNGAMHYWLTLFVEVPLSTFAPVKTVLDLLAPQHK